MLNGKQVKIIKRVERNDSQPFGSDKRPARVRTKRDAVTIITGWVSELRQKKSEEATNGFDSLFGDAI